jgi:hypothetical protein
MVDRPRAMMTISHHAGALALLASLALAATAAAPASAAAPPSAKPAAFALLPVGTTGALSLRAIPGHAIRGAVLVHNVSRQPVTVRLQSADIQNATNGNADYATTRPSKTGRWVDVAATTVHVAPGATRRVAFTVNVPARTRSGSHYAGIVAIDAKDLARAPTHKKGRKRTFAFHHINRQALPVTIRLPGLLSRRLALRSVKIGVQPAGAGLMLGLLPGGTELIPATRINLRVFRGSRTVFTFASKLGQLFPADGLNYRIPWRGRPTRGNYRVLGIIRPEGAAAIKIDEAIAFSPAKATDLARATPPAAGRPEPGIPVWVWVALAAAAAVLTALSAAVWKLSRRPA